MDDSGVYYTPVVSSNVESVGYDPVFARLWVKFKDGKVYAYDRVPAHIYLDFLRAPSKGQYLWRVIRANGTDSLYGYQRVR